MATDSKYIRYDSLQKKKCDMYVDIIDSNVRPLYTITDKKGFCITHIEKKEKNTYDVFIKIDCLQFFIKNIFSQITHDNIILYIGNGDYSPTPDQYDFLISSEKIKKIIMCNNKIKHYKITSYPIGFTQTQHNKHHENVLDHYYNNINIKTHEYVIYVPMFAASHTYRTSVLNKLPTTDMFNKETDRIDWLQSMQKLSEHRFCVTIRGNGMDVHWLYECIITNTYPLHISDVYFPLLDDLGIIQFNLETFLEFIMNPNYKSILNYLYNNIDWKSLKLKLYYTD